MFQAILFDVDGVLRDSKEAINESYRKAFSSVGLPYLFSADETWLLRGLSGSLNSLYKTLYALQKSNTDFKALLGGYENFEDNLLEMQKRFPLAEKNFPEMKKVMRAEFRRHDVPFYPRVKGTLEFLHKKARLGIVTDGSGETTRIWLERHDVNYFDVIIGSEDALPKPEPEGINKALALMKVKPSQACYVGDCHTDILAAKNAGVASVAITTGMVPKQVLEKYKPDYIINDISEVKKFA